MHRRIAALAVLAFLAASAAALAAGPSYVSQGGPGVLSRDGKTRYVAVATDSDTAIERVRVAGGSVLGWATLSGFWGIPAPTLTGAEGLSRDGSRLFVASGTGGSPTRFAVIDSRTMRILDNFELSGTFAYDALSPDASTLYLIQHVDADNVNRYVVRAYDLESHVLRPGRIADKTQLGWVMEGSAVTRTTSADGRWVYTLYQRPGGYPFIHALDTVKAVAHCIGLPWHGNQAVLTNLRMTLGGDGKTLAVHWRSGKPWLVVNTGNWRLMHMRSSGAFPLRWVLAGAGGAVATLIALTAFVVVRRRHPREVAPVAL